MKSGDLKVKVVKGLIMAVTTAAGALLASCVTKKEDPIEAGAGEVEGVFVDVPAEEVSTEEVTED